MGTKKYFNQFYINARNCFQNNKSRLIISLFSKYWNCFVINTLFLFLVFDLVDLSQKGVYSRKSGFFVLQFENKECEKKTKIFFNIEHTEEHVHNNLDLANKKDIFHIC